MVGFGGNLGDSKSEIDDHSNNSSSVLGGGSIIGHDRTIADEVLPTFGGAVTKIQ